MLFTRLALTLYGVWLVSAQSTTKVSFFSRVFRRRLIESVAKVSPPLNRGVGSYPAFFIYKDVDEIARPGGKLVSLPALLFCRPFDRSQTGRLW